jgi:hypothetical protein
MSSNARTATILGAAVVLLVIGALLAIVTVTLARPRPASTWRTGCRPGAWSVFAELPATTDAAVGGGAIARSGAVIPPAHQRAIFVRRVRTA